MPCICISLLTVAKINLRKSNFHLISNQINVKSEITEDECYLFHLQAMVNVAVRSMATMKMNVCKSGAASLMRERSASFFHHF